MTFYQIEYGRFSDPVQGKGDSKRRQASGHAWFAEKFDLTPWPEKFNDDGKSGWTGAHRKGDFGKFLTLAKAGKFPKGSVFVIEEMDRFSREKLSLVLSTWDEIIGCGLRIGIISEGRIFDAQTPDLERLGPIIKAILAHEESQKKSKRVKEAYAEKRKKAIEQGELEEHRGPAWCTWDTATNKWKLNEGAHAIKYIFQRTADEIGQRRLLRELQAKFPPLTWRWERDEKGEKTGKKVPGTWNLSYLVKVLSDRTVLGEHQHTTTDGDGNRIEIGPVIQGYYPAAIKESLWHRAQVAKKERKKHRGPSAKFVNLFTGLLWNAHDHCPMHVQKSHLPNGGSQRRLVSYDHLRHVKGADSVSVDYPIFERAMLQFLWELKINEGDKSAELQMLQEREQELAGIELRLREINEAFRDVSPSRKPAVELKSALFSLGERQEELKSEIEQLRRRLHTDHPLRHTKGALRALQECQEDERHDLRLRLRSLIPDVVESIWVCPEKHYGRVWCIVQVFLKSGGHAEGCLLPFGGDAYPFSVHDGPPLVRDLRMEANGKDIYGKPLPSLFADIAAEMVGPQQYTPPATVPDILKAAADVWLQITKMTMRASSFRVIPSKIERFVEFVGADTDTKRLDEKDWTQYRRALRAEITDGRLAETTARVAYSRAREFVRWLISEGVIREWKSLSVPAWKALKG